VSDWVPGLLIRTRFQRNSEFLVPLLALVLDPQDCVDQKTKRYKRVVARTSRLAKTVHIS
jgi:hypothetical protein